MAKTVVGLYDDISDARAVVQDLVDAGFARGDISLVANASADEYRRYFDEEGRYRAEAMDETRAGEGAGTGAGVGAAVGGLGGLLMGLGLLAIPGVGPALAAGPIVSTLVGAGIGAAAGGLVGALVGSGVPEEEAGYYAEGVRRGGSLVTINVADDRVMEVERIMNRHGPIDIEERVASWREEGFTRYDPNAEAYDADRIASERQRWSADRMGEPTGRREGETIPVVEEDVAVGKREVEHGGVRVRSYVVEEPVSQDVTLREEDVRVERRPVDRPLTDADDAFRERTVEMTESAEEAVVQKRARVTEEVSLEKDVHEHTETVHDTARHTEVEVEQLAPDETRDYREHFNTTFGRMGRTYEDYEPAYRYGRRLRQDRNFRDRGWSALEPELRRDWEARNPGTWDDYRDAIRYSYERGERRG